MISTDFFQTKTFYYGKILSKNNVPIRPTFYDEHDKGDLQTRFQQITYNEIISDPDKYFEKVHITNFDLIHNDDELEHDRQYYETLLKKKVDFELNNQLDKDMFLSSEQKYERKDVYFKKDLQKEHFNQSLVKEQLKKQGIFLSLMEKRKKCTDQCKSLPF